MSGLTIQRYFTSENQHPFDAVAWEVRDAVITGKDGTSVFEARGVEFPTFWSQRATDIVASKYFRVVNGERETSVKQMFMRVVNTIAGWGLSDSYFAGDGSTNIFRQELIHILLNQYACFNSPVWFNVGVQDRPQTSACYVLDVEDSMESILEWYRQEGMIFKGGSGSGVNLSKIRAKGFPLSNGGIASGVMSFARVADANAGAIKSGGYTRRAAKLLVLDVDHPEIEDFIMCKVEAERLARKLIELGYGNGVEGGAYDQVPWQNANNSVSIPDIFMEAITRGREDTWSAATFHKIAAAAWECGDPGLFFKDTINAWHTTPSRGPIVSANPCLEVLQSPNTACNLASLNLLKFLKDDGSFDIPAFIHTVDIMITAMDIMIDRSSYPTEVIAQNSRDYRPLGLGYANLGALLMAKGLPYDSDEGRTLAASITALMTGEAYTQSARLAKVKGAFTGFNNDRRTMHNIIDKHRDVIITHRQNGDELWQHAEMAWNRASASCLIGEHDAGFRNCQVSVLAPCGTISFMMDCDTTGVEPCLGLVTTKKLVGGGEITMVNGVVGRAFKTLGYEEEFIKQQCEFLAKHGLFDGNALPQKWFGEDHAHVFDTAFGDSVISWRGIPWHGHIKMVATVQPFISGGISKTINMSNGSTVQDVFDAYVMAWKMGLKSISIYRDGSKGVQPITVHTTPTEDEVAAGLVGYLAGIEREQKNAAALAWLNADEKEESSTLTEEDCFPPTTLQRRRLPDERRSITHKFTINIHEGYLTVGLYDDGSPGELFVRMSKEGSTLGGLMDAWATTMSIALQYGVPLDVLVTKFKDGQYEPRGFTSNPDIRTTSSITDYIVRWLELKFGKQDGNETEIAMLHKKILTDTDAAWGTYGVPLPVPFDQMVQSGRVAYDLHAERVRKFASANGALPLCSECGNMTIHNGSCCVCTVCGTTTGCS